uniref:(California timema) hypothetical protein n=1 Tax=Timema californicum TaxID=61474 RepID=A0A7R9J550_TIMCA|nr:unnamed protein product [Timema californicum]
MRWCAAALLCLVSLSDASLQFAPLAAPPDGECALLLDGPGRTSAFDYNLNALRGTLMTCDLDTTRWVSIPAGTQQPWVQRRTLKRPNRAVKPSFFSSRRSRSVSGDITICATKLCRLDIHGHIPTVADM